MTFSQAPFLGAKHEAPQGQRRLRPYCRVIILAQQRQQSWYQLDALVLPETTHGTQAHFGVVITKALEEDRIEVKFDVVFLQIHDLLNHCSPSFYRDTLPDLNKRFNLLRVS